METNNQLTASQATGKQDSNMEPQRKGGFVQGAAVAQGCCGEPGGSSGCCGAPLQAAVSASSIQATAEGGCCGAPAQAAVPTASVQPSAQSGCCGAPAATTQPTIASSSCCG